MRKFVLLAFLFYISINSFSQKMAYHPDDDGIGDGQIYLYVDTYGKNSAYLRKELPYINFVRDPQLSNVQLLITTARNASGGELHRIAFIGREEFQGTELELKHTSYQYQTEMEVREDILKLIQMGLMPYISQTSIKNDLKIDYKHEENQAKRPQETNEDPWNHWVFDIGTNGWYNEEESQKDSRLRGVIGIDRVTEDWRVRNDLNYYTRTREFIDDNEKIRSTNEQKSVNSSIVKSLSGRWSSGVFVGASSSSFSNLKSSTFFSPRLEYNIFPWEEIDRREFTIAYHTGIRRNQYIEETIYDKYRENLMFQEVLIRFNLIKPWGGIQTQIEGSHYLHDIKLNNIDIYSEISFRLTRFLFFDIEAGFESIHNQVYLPKGDASLEDILLQQRKLATTYELSFEVGLDFRFGSIYNNVINYRL